MANVNKTVDVAALELLCDKLDCGDANHRATAAQIRKAMNGATGSKSTPLPEGIVWPRFEDGELVRFGDEYVAYTGEVRCVEDVSFAHDITFVNGMSHDKPLKRPEPEVLDADGVPIKVGDTVYNEHHVLLEVTKVCADGVWLNLIDGKAEVRVDPNTLTHRKPDTFESVVGEMMTEWDASEGGIVMDGYFARFRKLMGGE